MAKAASTSTTRSRPFTEREVQHLRPIFGDAINYAKARIVRGHGGNLIARIALTDRGRQITPAITLGAGIFVHPSLFNEQMSDQLELVCHEATHIFQYRNALPGGILGPVVIAVQSLLKGGADRAYDVSAVTAETRFDKLGFEQQACVVEGYIEAGLKRNPERAAMFAAILRSSRHGLLAA